MYSVVIPVFNESESLNKLFEELQTVANEIDQSFEVIFVDDGSTDGSWQVIELLSVENEHVHGIRFRRNFGKAAGAERGL